MIPLITQDIATNIAYHTQLAWTYSVPNDTTGEIIITNGLKPFYPNAEQRGGSTTIVDVQVGTVAFDVKCRDVLGIFTKQPSEKQKSKEQSYFKVDNNLYVRRPNSVVSPVRRPSVDLENYQGDCQRIITEQIQEYKDYAHRTSTAAGCTELRSLLFLYGEAKGYKAIYIEEQMFSTPTPAHFSIYKNQKGIGAGYDAFDADKKLLYKLLDYSKGSTNFNKRFDCSKGFLFVWPSQTLSTQVVGLTNWQQLGNFNLEIN
jgi:hypothetical protein